MGARGDAPTLAPETEAVPEERDKDETLLATAGLTVLARVVESIAVLAEAAAEFWKTTSAL